jgi:hypothetical protein
MNITATIRNYITGDGTANALLAGRIYAGMLPQSTAYPAAVMNIITNTPTNTKTAASDLDFVLLQIDVYSTTLASVSDTAEAIRGAIDYAVSDPILHVEYKSEMDGYSGKAEIYRRICEYIISISR